MAVDVGVWRNHQLKFNYIDFAVSRFVRNFNIFPLVIHTKALLCMCVYWRKLHRNFHLAITHQKCFGVFVQRKLISIDTFSLFGPNIGDVIHIQLNCAFMFMAKKKAVPYSIEKYVRTHIPNSMGKLNPKLGTDCRSRKFTSNIRFLTEDITVFRLVSQSWQNWKDLNQLELRIFRYIETKGHMVEAEVSRIVLYAILLCFISKVKSLAYSKCFFVVLILLIISWLGMLANDDLGTYNICSTICDPYSNNIRTITIFIGETMCNLCEWGFSLPAHILSHIRIINDFRAQHGHFFCLPASEKKIAFI